MNFKAMDRVVQAMANMHKECNEPITMTWRDFRFVETPSREVQRHLVKQLKEHHNLLLLCLPKPLSNGGQLAVLSEDEFKASGGIMIPKDQMEDVAAMLDYNVDDMADFIAQKAEGKLKGDPQPEE